MRKRNRKTNHKTVLLLLIAFAAAVFLFSLFKVIRITRTYQEAASLYGEVESLVGPAGEEGEDWGTDPVTGEKLKYSSLSWDYPALLKLCGDAAGYIYQKDVLSYPVVQAEDNDKYLRHLLNGEYNIAGTLFVDARYPEGLDGRYSIIYGHNMDDGSMFGSITSYKDEAYYKAHPEWELYIGEDCYSYHVLAAFETEAEGFAFQFEPLSDEEFLELIREAKELCPYETDAPEITKDSVVTVLSTCIDYPRDYNYRFVVFLVREEKLLNRKYR